MGIRSSRRLATSDVESLARATDLGPETVLRLHKAFTKEFRDGKLTVDDFDKLYSIFTKEQKPGLSQHLFRAIDKERCGYIDFQVFLDVISAGQQSERKIDFVFRLLDVSNDGKIDVAELRAITAALGNDKEEEVERIFAEMDEDNDNSVSKEEFRVWWLRQQQELDEDSNNKDSFSNK